MPAHLIAEEGPLRGLVFNMEEGDEWIIGRDPDAADFIVEDSTVSRKHARLIREPEGIFLQNLSRINPVLINEEEASRKQLLQEGDRVQVGNTLFLYSELPIPESKEPRPKKSRLRKREAEKGYDDIFGDLEEPQPPEHGEPEDIERGAEEIYAADQEPEENAYDTIFEEEEKSEPIPFDLLSQTPLILKVISGPNAGAEIGIEKGRSYVIGKDPNTSDIVFQDLSVSRNHARLTATDEGLVEIEDLGSKNGTVVSGSPITEKRVLTPQDLVALGTTVFLIIDREAPQETIYSSMVPAFEPRPSDELSGEGDEELPVEQDWRKKPLPTKHLVMAGSFVAIFFVVFLSFFSLFKSENIAKVQKEPMDHIQEALAKFSDVQFSYNPGSGKLFLVGHVPSGVDYQELQYRLGELMWVQSVENNVVIDELVWRMTNDVLSGNPTWRGVSVHSPKAGSFVVAGYVETTEELGKLSDYLTVNFPYLDRLQNEVVAADNLTLQLQSLIQSEGLSGVSFQYASGEVIISGKYSEKLESHYRDFVKKVNGLRGVMRVKEFAVAVRPDAAGIDITQQYQVGGSSIHEGQGYSVILNGKIYTLGQLVDGMTITAIDPKTILLEKEGLKYRINYAR